MLKTLLQTLYLDAGAAAQEIDGKLEPVTEFLLFRFGTNETTQGTITLDEAAAKKVMSAYEKRTKGRQGWLDIDFFHLSRKENARLEDRRSAGRCKLELREDGIWCVDIRPTTEARTMLAEDQVRSYSPVVAVSAKGVLLSIEQMSLTNIPAMDDAGLLAAEDDTEVETGEELELSVTPFQSYPLYEGSTWDAKAADLRVREFLSSDGSDDFDKIDPVKYRKAFVFFDGEEPERASRYKGQILDVQDVGNGPELVVSKRAVQALGAIMQGSRGGIKVPDSDREKGKAVLAKYYKLFDVVAPWDREQKPAPSEAATEESKMLETPRVDLLMLEAKWSSEMRDMLRKAVGYRFGEHSYIDDWSPDKVRICVYGEGPMPMKHFEMPYTQSGDKIELGEPVEVKMSYVPVAQAAEVVAMQDRLTIAHTKLLEATGKTSTSEAIVTLEQVFAKAARVELLEARNLELEADRFKVARAAQVQQAKTDGRWTAALEERGDAVVDLARRCGEDPVKTLEAHWNAAPVMIAPGGMTPPKHEGQTVKLSETTEAYLAEHAKRLNIPLEDVRKKFLESNPV